MNTLKEKIIKILNQFGGGDLFSSVRVSDQLLSLFEAEQTEKIKEIKGFIQRKKDDVSLNKGTWMGDMEKYFEGIEDTIKDLEKILK